MKKFGLNLFNKEINSHEETKRNETKRNETKRLLLSLINNHFKTFLITLLSLTLLFSISCSNEDKTGGETETTVTIDAKDFPPELLGKYRDDKVFGESGYGAGGDTEVSTIMVEGIQKTQIKGVWFWLEDDGTKSGQTQTIYIETWKQTKKGGNPIKLEGEYVKGEEKYTMTYDYASGTLSGTYTVGEFKLSFNGKKIS